MSASALLAAAVALMPGTPAAAGTNISCGDVLTADTTLISDLLDCPGDGLIIGADGITVDLNDHEIHGTNSAGSVGIRNVDHDDVTIIANGDFEGVNISGFGIGVLIDGARSNEVSGNLNVEGDSYSIQLLDASGTLLRNNGTGFTAGAGCDTGGPAGIALMHSNHNRIVQNDAQLTGFGILLVQSNDNRLIRNTAAPKTSDGNNCSGIALFGSDRNKIKGNLTAIDDLDGIFVNATSDDTVVERNVAVFGPGAGNDDGIDVNNASASITENTANENGDLGIEAVVGVTDGGGNRASGNGDPRQCVNVVCS
jgi:parallel beta-helix repeat protein